MSSTGAPIPSINSADPVSRPQEPSLHGGQACLSDGAPMGLFKVGLPRLLLVCLEGLLHPLGSPTSEYHHMLIKRLVKHHSGARPHSLIIEVERTQAH